MGHMDVDYLLLIDYISLLYCEYSTDPNALCLTLKSNDNNDVCSVNFIHMISRIDSNKI